MLICSLSNFFLSNFAFTHINIVCLYSWHFRIWKAKNITNVYCQKASRLKYRKMKFYNFR